MLKHRREEPREVGDPETRRLLVEAGVRVFNHKTYLEATVEDITQEAGCARGTFYIYFKNKLDIFRAVCDYVAEGGFYATAETVREPDFFRRMVARMVAYLKTTAEHAMLMQNFHMMASLNSEFAAVHGRMTQGAAQRMRRHLELHLRCAANEQIDFAVASVALGQLVEGFARWWLAEGNRPDERAHTIEEVAVTLAALIYRSVHLEPSASREVLGGEFPVLAASGDPSSRN